MEDARTGPGNSDSACRMTWHLKICTEKRMNRIYQRIKADTQKAEAKHDNLITFVILGAKHVGKTALVRRFIHRSFLLTYEPTIEDCYFRTFYNKYSGTFSNIRVIDTSGYYHFPAMQRLDMSKANVLLLVYEVRNVQSMQRAIDLYKTAMDVLEGRPPVPVVFIGTKIDTEKDTDNYKAEMIEKFINENVSAYCRHLLTSARLDINVDEIFDIALLLLERLRTWVCLFSHS